MRSLLLPLLALFIASAATAAAPGAESFFRTPKISHVTLSPKGGYVAAVTAMPGGVNLLAVRDTSDPNQYQVVTQTSDQETITAVHWINEQRIGFTVKNLRIEFQGNQDEIAIDRDGKNMTHLISGNWEHQREVTGSSIKALLLTADYAYYDVVHDGSDDILVVKYTWNNVDRTPDHSRLYRLNTRTRQLRGAFEGKQPLAAWDWLTDAHDVPRVVTSQAQGRCIASYRKAEDTEWRELENSVCYQDERYSPQFFDGDDTLYVRASYKGYGALFRYNLNSMKMDAEPVLSVPGFDYEGWPEIDAPSGRLLGIHLQADAGTTWWLNPTLKAEQAKIDAMLPNTTNTLHCAAACLTAPVLLVVSSSDRQPNQYILYQRASGKLVGLGGTHPEINPEQMGMRDFYHYTARDGRSIPAYVTQPAHKTAGPQAAVVLVHGGPYLRGAYWSWDAEAQFLASRGYLVIEPEFRGSTGYGRAHFQAGLKQWGMSMQDDLADAAQWAVKQGWADPQRIAIMGASYGGYATLMGLIKEPQLFRCGVEWAGVTDIGLMFNTPYSIDSQDTLNYGLPALIGDPVKDADQFRRHSPTLRAAELKQPLLMAHGLEDLVVPVVHATSFRDAVRAQNAQVELVTYQNEGHGWRHEENRIDFWKRVDAFLERHLKPAP